MENRTSIIILVHNELELLKDCLDSVRKIADEIEPVSVVVADNASSDGLEEWAESQPDLSFAFADDGMTGWGTVIQETIEGFGLGGSDIVLMRPQFLLIPGCLAALKETLQSNPECGAAGPLSNGFSFMQCPESSIDSYQQAVDWSRKNKKHIAKHTISLEVGMIIIRKEAMEKAGNFDTAIKHLDLTVADYMFRLIDAGYELLIRCDAITFAADHAWLPALSRTDTKVDDMGYLRGKWGMQYFFGYYRQEILKLIVEKPEASFSVLEVGCDCGATLAEIRNRYPNARVYGLELNPSAAKIAGHVACVREGNIENKDLDFHEKFDYIIFADVLEHLHNPGDTVKYCRELLNNGGHIVASIPNIQHISVIEDLIKGNFSYQEAGLLDKTHIHFFTFNEIQRMFAGCGYQMESASATAVTITPKQEKLMEQLAALEPDTNKMCFYAYQYIVSYKK